MSKLDYETCLRERYTYDTLELEKEKSCLFCVHLNYKDYTRTGFRCKVNGARYYESCLCSHTCEYHNAKNWKLIKILHFINKLPFRILKILSYPVVKPVQILLGKYRKAKRKILEKIDQKLLQAKIVGVKPLGIRLYPIL